MLETQEPKYGVNSAGRLVNRETGSVIPDDEPVFILRARDKHAIDTLLFYLRQCEITEHCLVIEKRINDFLMFEENNQYRMREPGQFRANKGE